jgi:uncharacterized protein DUF3606
MQRKANHRPYVIDESNSWHVAWWATVLGVSEDSLLTAIALVGNESYAVEEYFGIRGRRELEMARGAACADLD